MGIPAPYGAPAAPPPLQGGAGPGVKLLLCFLRVAGLALGSLRVVAEAFGGSSLRGADCALEFLCDLEIPCRYMIFDMRCYFDTRYYFWHAILFLTCGIK